MRYSRSIARDGHLFPAVFDRLASMPETYLFFRQHLLRHPLAIFNTSISRVLTAFDAVLHNLAQFESAPVDRQIGLPVPDDGPLLDSQENLLHSLVSFIDDCYHILKAHFPPQPGLTELFADKWLTKAKHPTVLVFQDAVRPYRTSIAKIANRMKHQHGRLSSILFLDGVHRIGGYFLEGVGSDGAICPDPEIHPNNTAVSFHRDLRYHFVHVYDICAHLQSALIGAIEAEHQVQLPPPAPAVCDSGRIISVAERVAALPWSCFPDEAAMDVPEVDLCRDTGVELQLQYPGTTRMFWPGNLVAAVQVKGDGMSKSFRVPYRHQVPTGGSR